MSSILTATSSSQVAFRTPEAYGLRDDPTFAIDQTTALQAYLDANGGSGRAFLPKWRMMASQVVVKPGLILEGAGMGPTADPGGGTVLQQLPGANVDFIINNAAASPPNSWIHWLQIRNIRLQRAIGDTSTLGSGIKFNARTGENCRIDGVQIFRFSKCGIWCADGGEPLKFSNLHLWLNGEYGLRLGNTTAKSFSSVWIDTISGDQNGLGLIHLQNIQTPMASITLNHVKSEAPNDTQQDATVHIENCACTVSINTVTMQGVVPRTTPKSLVRITGPTYTPKLSVVGIAGNFIDNAVSDEITSTTVAWSLTRSALVYSGGMISEVDTATLPPRFATPIPVDSNADGITHVVPFLDGKGIQLGATPIYGLADLPSYDLFNDSFLSGVFTTKWTSTWVQSGALAINSGAALDGDGLGMQVTPSLTNNHATLALTSYRWRTKYLGGRVKIHLHDWAASATRNDVIWRMQATDYSPLLMQVAVNVGVSPKTVTMYFYNDAGSVVSASANLDNTASHTLEWYIQRASSATANDGICRMYVDDVLVQEWLTVDLYDMERVTDMHLGSVSGYTGFTGSFYLDAVVLRDNGQHIGV